MGKITFKVLYKGYFFCLFSAAGDAVWIGLNDRQVEGLFDWADHSTVRFINWESGNPEFKTEREDCVLIRGEVRTFEVQIFVQSQTYTAAHFTTYSHYTS